MFITSDKKSTGLHLSILGGGPAGLATGYYARKAGIPFTIYESSNRVGGNCITLKHGDFLFDSGAHRFHDKDPEVTNEIKQLLGEDLKKINAPSQIYYKGKFVDFPLSPLNLLMSLGFSTFGKACFEILKTKFQRKILDDSFESFALATYGRTIAEAFLLKYSEKLWGAPCHQLSRMISGKRLQGLDVKTFIKETLLGHRAKTQHLDGAFYYPKMGYGMIVERLAEICGQNNIVTNARITKIYHTHSSIQALEINGKARVDVQEVVSSLPLDLFLQMMEPSPVKEVQDLARSLLYRNVILVAFFLNKEFVTKNASLYFPNPFFPFTRVYEPKQRSSKMSPTGKTSLIAEIPCQYGDEIWSKNDNELIELVLSKFLETQLIQENEVIDSLVKRLAHAYPILELGYENKIEKITNFLNGFNNLKLSGRNGKFMYTHLHDMMRFGKELVQDFISEQCVIPASAHLNIH